jgi:uncharacterized phage-associated protein
MILLAGLLQIPHNRKNFKMSTTVFDVANYIVSQTSGSISAMKLQKLVYYAQAWSLVWDDAPLFEGRIEAWANGPVCRELYQEHRGTYAINLQNIGAGDANNLNNSQKETIDKVLEAYGNKSAQWLSDQTHSETPWMQARVGLEERERGTKEITHECMAAYYGSLI